MNKCIYLKRTEPELTFSSEEHIIPAGIGGLKKLNKGMVSDQVNTKIFSPLELDFMRNSHITLPRQFDGPGKRGSLVIEKASKSNIHLMNCSDEESLLKLGYIKLGKPYLISQVQVCSDGVVQFIFDKKLEDYYLQIKQLVDDLKRFSGKYQEIKDDRISTGDFILGVNNDRWYLAKNPSNQIIGLMETVNKIVNLKGFENVEPEYQKSQVISSQSLAFNIEAYFRVCAKIVFNFLALSKGKNFVLKKEFDQIREWIVNGGENKFANLMNKDTKPNFLSEIPFPDSSHKIFISSIGNKLIGIVSFYGGNFETIIQLSENINLNNSIIDGFICDWKNKEEYRLSEFINNLGY